MLFQHRSANPGGQRAEPEEREPARGAEDPRKPPTGSRHAQNSPLLQRTGEYQ